MRVPLLLVTNGPPCVITFGFIFSAVCCYFWLILAVCCYFFCPPFFSDHVLLVLGTSGLLLQHSGYDGRVLILANSGRVLLVLEPCAAASAL